MRYGRVRNSWNWFGTGIRPLFVGSQFHHFIRDATCPKCRATIDQKLPQLGRNYLSLLGIPVLPLNYVAVCSCDCGHVVIDVGRQRLSWLIEGATGTFRPGWLYTWPVIFGIAAAVAAVALGAAVAFGPAPVVGAGVGIALWHLWRELHRGDQSWGMLSAWGVVGLAIGFGATYLPPPAVVVPVWMLVATAALGSAAGLNIYFHCFGNTQTGTGSFN